MTENDFIFICSLASIVLLLIAGLLGSKKKRGPLSKKEEKELKSRVRAVKPGKIVLISNRELKYLKKGGKL